MFYPNTTTIIKSIGFEIERYYWNIFNIWATVGNRSSIKLELLIESKYFSEHFNINHNDWKRRL